MDAPNSPSIASFVIRFVMDVEPRRDTGPGSNAYRGEIRHIQTSEEIHFTAWEEAVAFIRRYVPLERQESLPED